jgi:hypothetical protein
MQSFQASIQLAQALDVYELLGGGKGLREEIDTAAGQIRGLLAAEQGVLNPQVSAVMWSRLEAYVATPQPIMVNPTYPIAQGTRAVYFVNGIQTTQQDAIADAQGLANQLRRPVALIYSPTTGLVGDVVRAAGDLAWFPPLPQPDLAARQLAGVLLTAWATGQPVEIVGFSEGAAIANDAIRTLDALGLGAWVYENVSVILVGAPLSPIEAAGTAHFQRMDNVGDPVVEFLGDRALSLVAKLQPPADSLTGLLALHSFLGSYVSQLSPAAFPG